MCDSRIGFIGLGNVGGKLAGSLLRHGIDLIVRDLDENLNINAPTIMVAEKTADLILLE